jgi:hypothetical protein
MAINYFCKNQAKIILGKKKKENSLIQEIFILIPKGLNAPFLEKNSCPSSSNPKGLENSRKKLPFLGDKFTKIAIFSR